MPAAVQDAEVGNVRRCATKQRMASRAWSEALLRIESSLRRHPLNTMSVGPLNVDAFM